MHAATAGLGRSALIDHFAARERDAIVVLSGRCSERESLPYKGVDGLIDALARELHARDSTALVRLCPPHIHTLARLFPVLRRVPAIARAGPDDAGLAPHELRQLAFEALRQLLARLARDAPLVLVLDDLHHGDHDSAALLRELLGPPVAQEPLLLGNARERHVLLAERVAEALAATLS